MGRELQTSAMSGGEGGGGICIRQCQKHTHPWELELLAGDVQLPLVVAQGARVVFLDKKESEKGRREG